MKKLNKQKPKNVGDANETARMLSKSLFSIWKANTEMKSYSNPSSNMKADEFQARNNLQTLIKKLEEKETDNKVHDIKPK